jgi:Uma2 family endonuclease
MSTQTLVSVDEYLRTSYEPDCEYVDGEVVERNAGEKEHSKLQMALAAYLHRRRKQWNICVFPEQRFRLGPNRFRIPDISVIVGPEPDERVFTRPPFVWIEILSSEDRPLRVQRKVSECLAFGVSYVWVIDPETLESRVYTRRGDYEPENRIFRTADPEIVVPLDAILDD